MVLQLQNTITKSDCNLDTVKSVIWSLISEHKAPLKPLTAFTHATLFKEANLSK